jgi:hypothetical protein
VRIDATLVNITPDVNTGLMDQFILGYAAAAGGNPNPVGNMTGGTINVNRFFRVGHLYGPGTTFNLYDGTVSVMGSLGRLQVTAHSSAPNCTLNQFGGTVACKSLWINRGNANFSGGRYNLNAGTLTISGTAIDIRYDGSIRMSEGAELILSGEGRLSEAQLMVATERVDANEAMGVVWWDYNSTSYPEPNQTVITVRRYPEQTCCPSPPPGRKLGRYQNTFSWNLGFGVIDNHIYMDTNQALVEARDPSVDRGYVDTNSYTHSYLDLGETYYLIADNNDGAFEWPGVTWIYPTYDFVMIDPVQDYADNDALRAVWQDGTVYDTVLNGAISRIETEAPLHETWRWATLLEISDMALELETSGAYAYSEVMREFAAPLDLDTAGATSLRIYWHGQEDNTEFDDKLYVALEDSLGNVAYSQWEDSNDFEQAIWSKVWFEWNIALTDFVGVDTDDIVKMYIGIGDRSDPCAITNNTSATIYFDDIQARGDECLSRNDRRLQADFAQQFDGTRYYDCTVGIEDLMIMRAGWLISSQNVTGASGIAGAPIAHWKFDESDPCSAVAVDSAAIDGAGLYDLTTSNASAPWDATGAPAPYLTTANCANSPGDFAFNMDDPCAIVGLFSHLSDGVTFAWWSHGNPDAYVGPSTNWTSPSAAAQFFGGKRGGGNQQAFMFQFPMTFTVRVGQLLWRTSEVPTTPTWMGYDNCSWIGNRRTSNFAGQWNHLTVTKDIVKGHQIAYLNGDLIQMAVNRTNPFTILNDPESKFHIFGAWQSGALKYPFVGRIDDFRIYDYALPHEEILFLAGREGETIVTGMPNGVEGDADGDDDVDLDDYAILANQWMQTQLWP